MSLSVRGKRRIVQVCVSCFTLWEGRAPEFDSKQARDLSDAVFPPTSPPPLQRRHGNPHSLLLSAEWEWSRLGGPNQTGFATEWSNVELIIVGGVHLLTSLGRSLCLGDSPLFISPCTHRPHPTSRGVTATAAPKAGSSLSDIKTDFQNIFSLMTLNLYVYSESFESFVNPTRQINSTKINKIWCLPPHRFQCLSSLLSVVEEVLGSESSSTTM